MDFRADKPIYRQIVDYAYGCILADEWHPGERVPSVRELGALLSVNSHTALKAYEYLTDHGVIAARRGMGYYLEPDAKEKVNADRRQYFFDETLSHVFAQMDLLGISIDDIVDRYRNR